MNMRVLRVKVGYFGSENQEGKKSGGRTCRPSPQSPKGILGVSSPSISVIARARPNTTC